MSLEPKGDPFFIYRKPFLCIFFSFVFEAISLIQTGVKATTEVQGITEVLATTEVTTALSLVELLHHCSALCSHWSSSYITAVHCALIGRAPRSSRALNISYYDFHCKGDYKPGPADYSGPGDYEGKYLALIGRAPF